MRYFIVLSFILSCAYIDAQIRYDVSSDLEFDMAQDQANYGDTIAWMAGTYVDIRQEIDKDGLIITALPQGEVLFTGASRVIINADDITFSGFQYIGGVIGSLDVIRVYGSDVTITQVNIQNYVSHKYLIVYEESRRTTISYCNFENRLNLDDQNILSILVDTEPGYHKIQYCSFKNFDGIGNDQGIEPIRIGVSSQGDLDSRTLVEYCYFTQCNGDGEIISHKSRQNVYRYNTFENNPVAELVLRHGDEGIVYGNFFLNNMGGIRIREGSDHYIYNNYFEDLDRRSIFLQNDPSDPLSNIHVYHNTIIHSEEVILGSNGSNPPTNVVIANNVFTNPTEQLFVEDTGNETWISNISFGNLGISIPSTGILEIDPKLSENPDSFFQPDLSSPLLGSASEGYPTVPLFSEMEYDHEIVLDLMKESRSSILTERAIGASELSLTSNVQPHANEFNTGPLYLFDNLVNYLSSNISQLYVGSEAQSRTIIVSSNIDWTAESNVDWISMDLLAGSGDEKIILSIEMNEENLSRSGSVTLLGDTKIVTIDVFQDAGEIVGVLEDLDSTLSLFPNPTDGKITLSNLSPGIGSSFIEVVDLKGSIIFSKEYIINDSELVMNLEGLFPGNYVLNLKFMTRNGSFIHEVQRRIVKK